MSPTVQYNLIRHDEEVSDRSDISWITMPPFKQHENWSMYEMPDGIHTVIIPKSDQFQMTTAGGIFCRAAIYTEKMYQVVNMKNGAMELSSGQEVAEAMKKPDIRMENERLKNLAHNLNMEIDRTERKEQTIRKNQPDQSVESSQKNQNQKNQNQKNLKQKNLKQKSQTKNLIENHARPVKPHSRT
ncbi:MAG: hypothetical protein LUF27_15625 [Lachnospiraceae bacterium]|nr:hypothetical protein [Lachnospiraceae bacterium]